MRKADLITAHHALADEVPWYGRMSVKTTDGPRLPAVRR